MGYMIVMEEVSKQTKIRDEVQGVLAKKANVYSALTTYQAFF